MLDPQNGEHPECSKHPELWVEITKTAIGLGYSSVAEHLSGTCVAWGSSPQNQREKEGDGSRKWQVGTEGGIPGCSIREVLICGGLGLREDAAVLALPTPVCKPSPLL